MYKLKMEENILTENMLKNEDKSSFNGCESISFDMSKINR